jgi:membrane protein implicated in regulation of membrane protease activity
MNKLSKLEKYIATEIGIELKSCLYFYCIMLFLCIFLMLQGRFYVSIITMIEIIVTIYIICNIQVYLFHNFDEADRLELMELIGILVCTGMYTVISYLLGWFERNLTVTISFALFMIFSYVCVYFVYKIKRTIETKQLNNLLSDYKKRKGEFYE